MSTKSRANRGVLRYLFKRVRRDRCIDTRHGPILCKSVDFQSIIDTSGPHENDVRQYLLPDKKSPDMLKPQTEFGPLSEARSFNVA